MDERVQRGWDTATGDEVVRIYGPHGRVAYPAAQWNRLSADAQRLMVALIARADANGIVRFDGEG